MTIRSAMTLSHLKFRHLMLVDCLVRQGSLHKAARHLSITQPAATAMLKDLEGMLGVTLFIRTRQGMTPTESMLALLDRSRMLLNEFGELVDAIQRTAQGLDIRLRVGAVPQAFAAFMPAAVERFRASGGAALTATEGTTDQLLDSLLSGRLDCMIGRVPNDELPYGGQLSDLDIRPLYDDDVLIVARPGHPLLKRRKLTLELLAQHPWVLQRRDSSVRRALVEAFLRKGLAPANPEVETASYLQNLAIVARSQLLTIAPRRAAEQSQKLGMVAIVPFTLGLEPTQVSLITRRSYQGHATLERFRDAVVWAVEHSE